MTDRNRYDNAAKPYDPNTASSSPMTPTGLGNLTTSDQGCDPSYRQPLSHELLQRRHKLEQELALINQTLAGLTPEVESALRVMGNLHLLGIHNNRF